MLHVCEGGLDSDLGSVERRLLAENAQLRRQCAEGEELIARHALLLREGDHRIKNSLQIVASLMGLQERRESNQAAKHALRTATARIQAVARIHDALQLGGGNDVVALGEVLETMCRSVHAMAGDSASIKVVVDVVPMRAPIALAQPIVLAVNELMVNALRHAFVGRDSGSVHVRLFQEGSWMRVSVADDGVGLPDGYLLGRGYGLNLVRMMAAKVGGELTVENNSGAHFTLSASARNLAP